MRERHNVPFVFSSNGHLFVEYDHLTGLTTAPRPLTNFPTPDTLKARYEVGMGFRLDSRSSQTSPHTLQGRRGPATILPGRRNPRGAGEVALPRVGTERC